MSSLQDLLAEDGFERRKTRKQGKSKDRVAPEESVILPIYICHDRRSLDFSRQRTHKSIAPNGSTGVSSKRANSDLERPNSMRRDKPAIDEVAIRAVISILGSYIGRYSKDENFRRTIREKCSSCLQRRNKDSDSNGIFANLELGIESIETLIQNQGSPKQESKMKSLRNSIRLLSIVSSLNSQSSRTGTTCGTRNSHLSACAQLYLAIIYKLEKNDRISARHLLQVFCDSPFLARNHLLPDLWEHFFLPHLLHLKIWYTRELELLSEQQFGKKEKKMKALNKVYNDQMDLGTTQFALYYKEWLKVGGVQAPPIPSVPLPSNPSYTYHRRRSSDSYSSHSSINRNLYQAVFGPNEINRQSMDASISLWNLEEEENENTDEEIVVKLCGYVHNGKAAHRRSSSQTHKISKAELWPEASKSDYLRFLTCKSEPKECMVDGNTHKAKDSWMKKDETSNSGPSHLSKAVTTICSSESLSDCEMAIHEITKAWLDSQGDLTVEAAISKPSVIEGMLEVLFASNNDEVLEQAISILAELVARKEVNKQVILNSDPQLEIFIRLLKNDSLFLKAAVLLYRVKPQAKQMISIEWVPLVLRVLEFGDQLQTLFTVRCYPYVAAYYFLDQLLAGFDEDRNIENARQLVSFGGLSVLVRRMEIGDTREKNNTASIIFACIRANGSCRHYLANNLNKSSILELIVIGKQGKSGGCAFSLLTELLSLNRRSQITKFLTGLKTGEGSLNTMHIMLAYIKRAPAEERPLVAATLLQLDLLGDPCRSSVYREEVMDAIIAGLGCQVCNEKVQQQSARALLLLGGCFSYVGEASAEKWLLRQAGFYDTSNDSFHRRDVTVDEIMHSNEEEEAMRNWLRNATIALLTSGKKKLLVALSDCIANGIPCLARASLVTVSWMTTFLQSIVDENLHLIASSTLSPMLLESLKYDRALEERILASFSLLNLTKCTTQNASLLEPVDEVEELIGLLRNLSLVTWTASELVSILKSQE
ncbi:hypothetical protein RJ641_017803 [Dillenia turbinata]|uniref:E3 ubiquitin-protein ligase LIN n=1 Tax=Dillenia turbinata TaxID=194707 RepID=A0AAN8UX33_9MAGN